MPALNPVGNLCKTWFSKMIVLVFLLRCTGPAVAFSQTFTVLDSFTGGADGGYPSEGLVLDSAGNLYGATTAGGTGDCKQDSSVGCGTVFKLTEESAVPRSLAVGRSSSLVQMAS
jgi:hypothetical protein